MRTPPQLPDKELRYLQDKDFLSTKLSIMKTLQKLLEQAQQNLQLHKDSLPFPAAVWQTPPKISRGENYESLPYLVLDYPRIFLQDSVFAYRTMFWWGWGFSCTLHLGGAYWQQLQERFLEQLSSIKNINQWWVCIHESPWEYHYRSDNYVPLTEYLQQPAALQNLAQKPFFKISSRIPLERYQDVPELCYKNLRVLSGLLG